MFKRVGLLFLTCYSFFIIFDFTSSYNSLPHFFQVWLSFYTDFWHWFVSWSGAHILHLHDPVIFMPYGSGDTTFNYVFQFLCVSIALLLGIVWALPDRKRVHYAKLAYWLRVVIRYFLAYILFEYGFIKVIKLQFPTPDLNVLTETYGESSPMRLAWTFIGYSTGYNIFIGGAEILGGCLLLFKRTTLLGALLTITVMTNVAAMNLAYDIPVKIFSINLVFFATCIAAYDWVRLRNVFLLNRPAPAFVLPMPQPKRWKRLLQLGLKAGVIFFALNATLLPSLKGRKDYGEDAPKPPLYGLYKTTLFTRNGDTIPPLTTDKQRWKNMIITRPGYATVTTMDDTHSLVGMELDTVHKTLVLTSPTDNTDIKHFHYTRPDKSHLTLTGNFGKDSSIIQMQRFDESDFLLMNRGFHWVNEYPFSK